MTAHTTSLLGLALRSLRYRAGGYVASFLTLFLGATILMTFASLLDTGAAVKDEDAAATLTIMASVVGGWGLIIVAFAAVSTLTLLVRQRDAEMALLKSLGATPAQIGRMLLGEAGVLAVLAALAATIPSMFTGRMLVDMLKDGQRIPADVPAAFGPFAVGIGAGVTVTAAVFAAVIAARRTTRTSARDAMVSASSGTGSPKAGRVRAILGTVMLAAGISCGVVAMTALSREAEALMAVSGQAAILCGIGLALLAPTIIATIRAAMAAPLRRAGVGGYLTAVNLRAQSTQLATALAPIILFTAIATGTLYMQGIENSTTSAMPAEIAKTIETLNYVVVGMIALFAAVMLTNTLVATTLHRRREFGQLRLVGSTRPQLLWMVGIEAAVLAATGVLFGSIAATATVLPYSYAKTGSILPDTTIVTYLGIIVLAAGLTLAASLGTARRTIRPPAIEAIAAE